MMSEHNAMIDYAYIQRVARVFCRRLPRWACLDAEDLAQESALGALRGRKSRKGPMQDALRKQGWLKQHRGAGAMTGQALNERTCSHSPESRLVASIDIDLLLSRLTAQQRQAVALHHLAGMTEAEMSRSLAIPIQRVKNRIHQGLKNMRRRAHGLNLEEKKKGL